MRVIANVRRHLEQIPVDQVAVVVVISIFAAEAAEPRDETINCDSTRGAVDLDRCPSVRRELEDKDRKERESCVKEAGGGLLTCLDERLQRTERVVEQAYRKAIRIVEDSKLLREAHAAWKASHVEDCRNDNSERQIRCEIGVVEERLEQMNTLLNGECIELPKICPKRRR